MTSFDTVIRHINQGTTYSWDLTILIGLGLAISAPLREKLLRSRTTSDEAAIVTSMYTRKLLERWQA
jgi:hypothetical protein